MQLSDRPWNIVPPCAWHYALTEAQTQQLKAVQKRAIQMILNFSRGMSYSSMLFAADFITLASRRDDISRKFFRNTTKSTSCVPSSARPKHGIP